MARIVDRNTERVYAAATLLKQPDQIPVEFFASGDFIASFAGIKERQYYFDPSKMLEAQLFLLERFYRKGNFFNVVPLPRPDLSVNVELSAFGCRIRWPEDSTPFNLPAVRSEGDLDRLEFPDCTRDGLMPMVLETIDFMRQKVKNEHVVGPPILRGIPSFAAQLRGINEFLVDLRINPQFAHRLLEICMRVQIEWCKVLEEKLGEEFRVLCCDDISGFMSPKMFKEFSLPYNKRLFDVFKHPLNLYHCDADTQQILELVPELGAEIFHMGPNETCDLGVAKMKIGDKICLMGNVAPFDVMQQKGPPEVENAALECIKKASNRGGYILSPGGVLNRGTPYENLNALILTADKYGRQNSR